jgi:hypothetical protein
MLGFCSITMGFYTVFTIFFGLQTFSGEFMYSRDEEKKNYQMIEAMKFVGSQRFLVGRSEKGKQTLF